MSIWEGWMCKICYWVYHIMKSMAGSQWPKYDLERAVDQDILWNH